MELIVTTKQELSELINDAISDAIGKVMKQEETPKESILIHGILGLANFLGVSMPTAQKYKNEKVFPYIQRGRTVIFKSEEVLAGMARRKNKSRF